MSQENVEVMRQAFAAFNAHDLERWAAFWDPDLVLIDHMGAPAEESVSGLEALRRQVEGWLETFPDFRAEVEEIIDAGGDNVITVTHWQGTGAGSGLPYSQRAAELSTVRGGRIVRAELGFADKNAALKAAGLQEG